MTNEPLDESYFVWLYGQVGSIRDRNKSRTHWALLKQLYKKEFVWIEANDDNRVADGRDLRFEFMTELGIPDHDDDWMHMGCSMLEMLIALSRRLAFETSGDARDWFWKLIDNLELSHITDANYVPRRDSFLIDEVCNRVIFRTYKPDGSGGLFPLKRPYEDQRRVEIWYQLNAYLMDTG